ncbi:hypothetical protein BGX23_009605 [Mortierella sp. AD031]|nr:hypothetical protein BGX23_009605 [Mortierella sp. AD031]
MKFLTITLAITAFACVLTEAAINLHPRGSEQADGVVSPFGSKLRARSNPLERMTAKRQDRVQLQSCEQFRKEISDLVLAAEGYFQLIKTGVEIQGDQYKERIIKPMDEAIKTLRTAFDVAKQENFVNGDNGANALGVADTPEGKELMDTLHKISYFSFSYIDTDRLNCASS